MLNYDLESYLNEMGILPSNIIESLEQTLNPCFLTLTKGYFNDPRDENGEVDF